MITWEHFIAYGLTAGTIITTILIFSAKNRKSKESEIELNFRTAVAEIKVDNKENQKKLDSTISKIFDKIDNYQTEMSKNINYNYEKLDMKYEKIISNHESRLNRHDTVIHAIKIHHGLQHPNDIISD